ncbi:hypothetical protein BB561_002433 [Smittium simulii]|uniref:Alpha/beta hydrolase fold-3 domain-containing protein n=1 Tax=Smittium simulii TaxID=133385 RepID=A0A2T9YQJ9_9FUNG|nr:hypothetical protein BB561_002433 [Smittium simulii]
MTSIVGFGYPKNGSEDEKASYNQEIVDLIEKTTLKYNTQGPRVPNWTLGMEIVIDKFGHDLHILGEKTQLVNESNFDAKEVEKAYKIIRDIEVDISNRDGDYRKRYWNVSDDALLISPTPVFDKLISEDIELKNNSNPRQLFAEVVASKKIIGSAIKSGMSYEQALNIEPLSENETVILFFHGGGFYLESPGTNRGAALEISEETGYRVMLPDYRYAPVNPFPASIYDGYLFYKFLTIQGFKPKNIIIMGDSAGGNWCLCNMQILKESGQEQPKAAVLLSPWCDLSFSTDSWKRNVGIDFIPVPDFNSVLCDARIYTAPGKPFDESVKEMLRHPLVSPIHGNYNGCAPMYIQSGEVELLVDDIDKLAEKIGAKEVYIKGSEHPGIDTKDRNIYEKYAGMVHIFFHFEESEEKKAAIKGIGNYLRNLDSN